MLGFMIRGISISFISGSRSALFYKLTELADLNYKKVSAKLKGVLNVSSFAGKILAGLILHYWGVDGAKFIFAITAIIHFINSSVFFTIDDSKIRIDQTQTRLKEFLRSGYKFMISNKQARMIIFGAICFASNYPFFRNVLQSHYEQIEVNPLTISLFFGFGELLKAGILTYFYEYLTSNSRTAYFNLYIPILIAFVGLSLTINSAGSLAFLLILLAFYGLDFPLNNSILNKELDDEVRSTALSYVNFIRSFANLTIKLICTFMISTFDIRFTLFAMFIYLSTVLIFFTSRIRYSI